MLKQNARRIHVFLLLADMAVSAAVFTALAVLPSMQDPWARSEEVWFAFEALGALVCLAWPLILDRFGMYASHRRDDLVSVLRSLAAASGAAVVMLAAVAALIQAPIAPIFPLAFGLASFLVLGALRVGALSLLRSARRAGVNIRNLVVVGSGPRARSVERVIEAHPEWGHRIVAFIDDGEPECGPAVAPDRVKKLIDLPALLREEAIDEVLVACPRSMLPSLGPVVEVCATVGVPVTVLSDLFGDHLPSPKLRYFDTVAALSFAPVHHNEVDLALKRLIDVVGSGLALTVAAPVLGLAAVLIKLDSPGPVFFRQLRCGLNGRRFEMLKLRTMCANADAKKLELLHLNEMDGPVFKIKDDPRVTRVGRFLRRWSLDELPQFWHVLTGDMSLVGPRPPTPDEVVRYQPSERRRLSMRPGVTCTWQVSGRNEICFADWMKLDLQYIDNWSLGSDLRLLFRTIPAVLLKRGAS